LTDDWLAQLVGRAPQLLVYAIERLAEHAHEFAAMLRFKGSSPARRRCSRRQVVKSRAPCR
jgi:hypothetical protein